MDLLLNGLLSFRALARYVLLVSVVHCIGDASDKVYRYLFLLALCSIYDRNPEWARGTHHLRIWAILVKILCRISVMATLHPRADIRDAGFDSQIESQSLVYIFSTT